MRRPSALVLTLAAMLVPFGASRAQEADETQAVWPEQVAGNTPEAKQNPPPAEDVMHPTRLGIRITPRLAEALGKQLVRRALEEKISFLEDEQRAQLVTAISRRALAMQAHNGGEVWPILEDLYGFLAGDHKVSAEKGREVGSKLVPAIPVMHDFYNGLLEDARPILNDSQMVEMKAFVDEGNDRATKMENRMNRWARGEAREGEDFFDRTDEDAKGKPGKNAESKDLQRARFQADRKVEELGPQGWQTFLSRSRVLFGFTDEQTAAANRLLTEYRGKARAVMTTEWRKRARENLLQHHAALFLRDMPVEPWLARLDREYNEQVEPMRKMGREFRQKIVALATPEQRRKVLADMQQIGAEHGVRPEEMDAATLKLATTQPAEQ